MKLADVQHEIQSGDVFLFRGRKLFSRIIRWKTQSVYSHAGVALSVQVDGLRWLAIMEAMERYGVRLYPMAYYLEQCTREGCLVEWYQLQDTYRVGSWEYGAGGGAGMVRPMNRDKVASYVLRQWGKPYANWLQFLVSFGGLFGWLRYLVGAPPWKTGDRFFCSELVTAALEAGGYEPDEHDGNPLVTDPGAVGRFTCLERRGFLEA